MPCGNRGQKGIACAVAATSDPAVPKSVGSILRFGGDLGRLRRGPHRGEMLVVAVTAAGAAVGVSAMAAPGSHFASGAAVCSKASASRAVTRYGIGVIKRVQRNVRLRRPLPLVPVLSGDSDAPLVSSIRRCAGRRACRGERERQGHDRLGPEPWNRTGRSRPRRRPNAARFLRRLASLVRSRERLLGGPARSLPSSPHGLNRG
jgi:hypothetical protein